MGASYGPSDEQDKRTELFDVISSCYCSYNYWPDFIEGTVKICEVYGSENNLVFSTDPNPNRSKTKCILFSGNSSRVRNPDPVMLDGKDLPWVEKCEHLGHVFSQSLSMKSDPRVARSSFMKRAESQWSSRAVVVCSPCSENASNPVQLLWCLWSNDLGYQCGLRGELFQSMECANKNCIWCPTRNTQVCGGGYLVWFFEKIFELVQIYSTACSLQNQKLY